MDRAARKRLLRESDSGREFGWAVEFRGRRVALLVDPVWDSHSQFWHHYRLVPVADDPAERRAVTTPEFWEAHLSELVYRNLGLGEVAPNAFPRPGAFDDAGRVWMRGLYLTEDPPRPRRLRPRHVVPAVLALLVAAGAWWYWSGSPRATVEAGTRACAVAFSPDGTLLAAGGARTDFSYGPESKNAVIRLWDPTTWRPVATWTTRGHHVTRLAFDPGGRTLTSFASIGDDVPHKCEVRVWDLATLRELAEPRTVDYPNPFPLTPPTGRVAAKPGGLGVLAVCDAATGAELYRAEADRKQLNCAAFSPHGLLIATGGGDTSGSGHTPVPGLNGDVRVWEVGTGRLLATYSRHSGPIEGVAFAPDGRSVASASLDGTVKVWAVPGR